MTSLARRLLVAVAHHGPLSERRLVWEASAPTWESRDTIKALQRAGLIEPLGARGLVITEAGRRELGEHQADAVRAGDSR